MMPASKEPTARNAARMRRPAGSKLRARVTAAFAELANAVDARTASSRTHAFYRSSGADWTRAFEPIGGADD
jgi:hypothetical protein